MQARVASVNVGTPRDTLWQDRVVRSAIWKSPVTGHVRVAGVNLDGDDQADRRVHGGDDKAVYAYALEDYEWWSASVEVGPGAFGENLTTQGIDLGACAVGDRWQVGSVSLEIAQPREPCFKLGMRMNDEAFPGTFERAQRPGAYLRIVTAGTVAAGDAIVVTPTHAPRVTLREMVGELGPEAWRTIADDPRFAPGWRRRAERALGL